MKKTDAILIPVIALILVMIVGCDLAGEPSLPELDDGEAEGSDPGDQVLPSQNKVMLMATWTRLELIVDGQVQPFAPATLILQEDTFIGTGACTTSGMLSAEEETFTLVMTESNCPNTILPFELTYIYQIEDNGMTLITETANVVEIFRRE
jgi:hypothetical protein